MRVVLLVAAAVGVGIAFRAIGDTFLIVFVGIFLGLVFEYPVRFVTAHTPLSRGLAATVTVLGTAIAVFVLALLLLAPLVGSVRDFLQQLPSVVEDLREAGGLSSLGDTGAAGNVQNGADTIAKAIPDAISEHARDRGHVLRRLSCRLHDPLHLPLPAHGRRQPQAFARERAHARRRGAVARRLGARDRVHLPLGHRHRRHRHDRGHDAGPHAFLLGSSYAVALGVIAGLLDLIPDIGATIAGFILVPTLWAEEGITAAMIMLVVILVYQQFENNIIRRRCRARPSTSRPSSSRLVHALGALLGVLGALTAVRSPRRSRSPCRN